MKQDDSSVPSPDGPWEYYVRYEPGRAIPGARRCPRGEPDGEQVLVDADALAQGHQYYALAAARHSPDHRLFAYAEDTQGSEVYRVRVKDLATGALLPDAIENCTGNFAWSADGFWLFWTFRDENGRPARIYRRPVPGGPDDDVLVYAEPDPGFFLRIACTASRAWLVIACGDQQTSEAWLIPAADPTTPPRLVEQRQTGVRYNIEHWTAVSSSAPTPTARWISNWSARPRRRRAGRIGGDWVAHEPGRLIVDTAAYAGHFARLERVNANNRIVVTSLAGDEHVIGVDEEAYVLRLGGSLEYDTATLRYTYESPATPRQWFDFDMRTHAATLRKTQGGPVRPRSRPVISPAACTPAPPTGRRCPSPC